MTDPVEAGGLNVQEKAADRGPAQACHVEVRLDEFTQSMLSHGLVRGDRQRRLEAKHLQRRTDRPVVALRHALKVGTRMRLGRLSRLPKLARRAGAGPHTRQLGVGLSLTRLRGASVLGRRCASTEG